MAAEGSAGTADAEIAFQFPLKKDLDFDDVSLQVAAQVEDGALRNVFRGQDMTAAQLDVAVAAGSLQLSGQLVLGGVPYTVHWQERFAVAPEVRPVTEPETPHIDTAGGARVVTAPATTLAG